MSIERMAGADPLRRVAQRVGDLFRWHRFRHRPDDRVVKQVTDRKCGYAGLNTCGANDGTVDLVRVDHLDNTFGVESKDMLKSRDLADISGNCCRGLREPSVQGRRGSKPQYNLIALKVLRMCSFIFLTLVQQIAGCAKPVVSGRRQFDILSASSVDELCSKLLFELRQLLRDARLRQAQSTLRLAD